MKYAFFDLDGTLTDSARGIINSVKYAVQKLGATLPDPATLRLFVGPPLSESFVKYCGIAPEDTRRAIMTFREYFAEKGIFENDLYPGVPEMLASLRANGITPVLTTSKPERFANEILTHFNIRQYFLAVYGNTMDERYTDKGEFLNDVLTWLNIGENAKRDCVMVGDRKHDVEGAHAAGLKAIGVLYGYGSLEELRQAGADFLAATVEEVASLLND